MQPTLLRIEGRCSPQFGTPMSMISTATTPSIKSTVLSTVTAYSHLIAVLGLIAMCSTGSSHEQPTKDQRSGRANEARSADHFDQAVKDYREVLRLAHDDPIALRQLGLLYHYQGQILQALPLLMKSAELEPDN